MAQTLSLPPNVTNLSSISRIFGIQLPFLPALPRKGVGFSKIWGNWKLSPGKEKKTPSPTNKVRWNAVTIARHAVWRKLARITWISVTTIYDHRVPIEISQNVFFAVFMIANLAHTMIAHWPLDTRTISQHWTGPIPTRFVFLNFQSATSTPTKCPLGLAEMTLSA